MSDLIRLSELLTVADDESATAPPLPPPAERRAIRLAADVPVVHLAAAVGVATPTLYRAETGSGTMRNATQLRRYRRVLGAIRGRLLARDPSSIAAVA